MYEASGRVEFQNGIRFYEQDILYDNYVYTNDIQLVLNVDYMTPGIGVALLTGEGLPLQEQKEAYLFRVGYRDASVHYRLGDVQKRLSAVATSIKPPMQNMQLVFTKRARKITMAINGNTVMEYTLPSSIDRYSVGLYSNAGNTLKTISIASSIPDFWNVNMLNTEGGYLRFQKNGFDLTGCTNAAEMEQAEIKLQPGTYYLRYTKGMVNSQNDIVCYVMKSGDDRFDDEEKNILHNGSFTVQTPGAYNIKFKGKNGSISDIHITDKLTDKYVATKNEQAVIEGSYILIHTGDLAQVKWSGTIQEVPVLEVDDSDVPGVLIAEDRVISWSQAGVVIGGLHTYILDMSTLRLTVYRNESVVQMLTLSHMPSTIYLFKNMDAVITEMSITNNRGETTNLIVKKTTKRYVPASVGSPIVVVDEAGAPLDISSSYRSIVENGVTRYVFTNWEREIFTPGPKLQTEKRISSELGSVSVYGIPKNATVNMDRIFQIPKEGLDTINLFCEKYDSLKEKDLHYIDKFTGEIFLSEYDKYQMVVVDYLKRDSCCINFDRSNQAYEVDISSESDNVSLIYDHSSSGDLVNLTSYKMTELYPDDNCYIVLRREGF